MHQASRSNSNPSSTDGLSKLKTFQKPAVRLTPCTPLCLHVLLPGACSSSHSSSSGVLPVFFHTEPKKASLCFKALHPRQLHLSCQDHAPTGQRRESQAAIHQHHEEKPVGIACSRGTLSSRPGWWPAVLLSFGSSLPQVRVSQRGDTGKPGQPVGSLSPVKGHLVQHLPHCL